MRGRTRLPRRPAVALGALTLGPLLVAGCSSDGSSGPAISVVSTTSECQLANAAGLRVGANTFEVENRGDDVTEVYVYGPGDRVIAEKENIGPGTKARFTARLAAGDYEIACKPGQTGNGIRQPISVGATPTS